MSGGTAKTLINANSLSDRTAQSVYKLGITSSDAKGADVREYVVGGGANPASSRGGASSGANALILKNDHKICLEMTNTGTGSMTLNLISLATVKAQLGITSTTYDAALTALIPIVSDDVRRILNDRFDKYITATITSGSPSMTWASWSPLKLGTVVYSPALPADTYVQSYDPTTGVHTLSANATASATYIYPTVSISQWPAISKMVWHRYTTQNTSSVDVKGVASESFGPVSVSYTEKEINKQYNYPYVLLADLGKPRAGIA